MAHFTTKALSYFHFNLEQHLELFTPALVKRLRRTKVSGFGVHEWSIKLFAHQKRKRISVDYDLFSFNCLNCQFNTDCILQYAKFHKKHSRNTKK